MFTFIRKLFKVLNSSGKSWQLSGAIILAMFAGFLPSNSLILLDLLFIALILNVNFGLFILFSVIFSGVGYLFDPLFESLGYAVLTSEGLNGLFTSLYNSALFRWSAFNYTLVTGALVVSAVLAVPMLLILNKIVSLYRVQLGQKFNEWKLTRWMKLFNEEAQTTSIFRWWGLGVFGGLAAFILVIFIFVFDPLARVALEKSLAYTLQTEVNVDDFSSSLSDLKVTVSGVQIADKDKLTHNVVELKSVGFDLSFAALMDKKVMIEDLGVDALAFGTLRKTPAEPYCSSSSKAEEASSSESASTSSSKESSMFTMPSVDDILAKEELKSITEAQKLRSDIALMKTKWTKVSNELSSANDVNEIKADASALTQSLKGGDISKVVSAKADIDKLKNKISTLESKYSNLQKEFDADQESIQTRISNLKNLPAQDIQRLKSKYAPNATGGTNLVATMLKGELGGYMEKTLGYYEMLKPYLDDKDAPEPQEVTPPRGQGRWVKYANLSTTPDFVVKNAQVNVVFEGERLDMNIKEFSSNQGLYGKPMTLSADAKGKAYEYIVANLVDDRRTDISTLSFDVDARGVKTAAMQMQTLSMKDISSNAILQGEIVNQVINAKSEIKVTNVSIEMPSQAMVSELLSGVSKFNVGISLKGDIHNPSIGVSTDLDKRLSGGLHRVAAKASKKFEKKLKSAIMAKVSGSTGGIDGSLGDAGSLLSSKQGALSGISTDFTPASSVDSLKKMFKF